MSLLMSVAVFGSKVECSTAKMVYNVVKDNEILFGGMMCFGLGYGTKKVKDWYLHRRKIERFKRYVREDKAGLDSFREELRSFFGVVREEVKVPKGVSKVVFYLKLVVKIGMAVGIVCGIVWLYRLGKVNSLKGLSDDVVGVYGKSGLGRQDLLRIGQNMLRPSNARLGKC